MSERYDIDPCGEAPENARCVPSPNFDARPADMPVSLIVIHAISLPPSQFGSEDIVRLFTNTLDPAAHPYFSTISRLRVSSHFLIRRNGELIQFVSCRHRAWHAGLSCWEGRARCNDFSIGIELEGCDEIPFDAQQYRVLDDLIDWIALRHPIRSIVGHADVSPGRKTDPGPLFDWRHLAWTGKTIR